MEISDVERVEDASLLGRESQLLLVALPETFDIQYCDDSDGPGSKSRDQTTLRGVFINVESDLIHSCGLRWY